MSNVIEVDFNVSEKNGYSALDNKMIGVVNKTTNMELCESGEGFEVFIEGRANLSREEMAEWLWMAAYMLDSEGRYKFDEYVGLNYKE